jgi:hypothetical protein
MQFQDGGKRFKHKVKGQKKREISSTHVTGTCRAHTARFVVTSGELVGKLMYMSNTYKCLDRVCKYRGRRESQERGHKYTRTAAFSGVIGKYMQQGSKRWEKGR